MIRHLDGLVERLGPPLDIEPYTIAKLLNQREIPNGVSGVLRSYITVYVRGPAQGQGAHDQKHTPTHDWKVPHRTDALGRFQTHTTVVQRTGPPLSTTATTSTNADKEGRNRAENI